jgi:hypothetical protein
MTTLELQSKVIDKINNLTDNDLLMDLIKLIEDNSDDTDIYRLSENHKIAIDIAIEQIKNGDFISNQQANKEIDEWLSR